VADPGSNGVDPGHADHDPELIVALLDRDLVTAQRAAGEDRLRACAACAALHADLLSLADASREMATPVRTRDFTLSAEVAQTLQAPVAAEPAPGLGRLIGEMTEPRSAHAAHDRVRIANLVDRSVSDAERLAGEAQLTACRECAQLFADLLALSAATKALPIPARPRDFTLTPTDAARLRVRGWRRLLAVFGSPRDVFSRPLAIGLSTLGLAGLLVATVPGALPGFGGAAAALPAAEDAARNSAGGAAANPEFLTQASAAPSAASETGPVIAAAPPSAGPSEAPAPAPAESADAPPEILAEGADSGPTSGEPDDRGAFDAYLKSFADGGSAGPSPMVVVAAILLLVGLGLFGLRWTARRLGDG
jgi:anti-sigma factor RsiW